MFERFTDRARRVVVLAQEEARLIENDEIGPEHILLGLIHEGTGVAARALAACSVSLDEVRAWTQAHSSSSAAQLPAHIPFAEAAKGSLLSAVEEADAADVAYIGTEHLLLGLVRDPKGRAATALLAQGVEPDRVRKSVIEILGDGPPSGA